MSVNVHNGPSRSLNELPPELAVRVREEKRATKERRGYVPSTSEIIEAALWQRYGGVAS